MKLRSLEISGFKSFADYTKIEFEDGVTGIVGPNGSGKSNVTEAIKWVLGEQSAKSLRGARMPDVIFAGTSKRKPLNRAVVTMILDNSDHYVDSDYTEISVTRKLFRNGESVYELNGQECRLRDITDLFSDSGIGGNAFSMISQGRVEAIFNSKPEDRRFIIEEVTGVSKYKNDKEKAKRELDKTAGYLDRVNDLIAELETRVEPLAQESSLAQDYVNQKRDFDRLDQSRLVLQIQAQKEALASSQDSLTSKQAQIDSSKKALEQHQERLAALKSQNSNLQAQKDDLQKTLLEVTQTRQQLVGEQALSKERKAHRNETVAALKQRIETLTQQQVTTQATLKQQQVAFDDAKKALEVVNQEAAKLQEQLAALDRTAITTRIETMQDDYIKLMQELTSVHNQKAYLEKNQHRADSQSDRTNQQLSALKEQLTTLGSQLSEVQEKVAADQQTLTHAKDEQAKASDEQARAKVRLNQLNQEWLAALEENQQAKARAKSLEAVAENYTGFYQGTRAVLKAKEKLSGIIGPVAELLKVADRYTKAVETALGAQQQNVVVENESAGKAAIQYLNQNRLGRSTFLPLTTIRPKQVDGATRKQLIGLPGYLGVGSELVEVVGDARLDVLRDYLLGNVLFVDNLDHAVAINRQLKHRYRMITLDGDVISATGAMTGGRAKRDTAGLLTQQQELTQLLSTIQKMDNNLTQKKTQVDELRAKVEAIDLNGFNQNVAEASNAYQTRLNEAQLVEQQIATIEKQIKVQTTEQALQGGEEDYQKALAENAAKDQMLNAKVAALTQELAAAKAQLSDNEVESQTISGAYQEKKEQVAAKRVLLDQLKRDVTGTTNELENLKSQLADFNHQLKELTQTVMSADDKANSNETRLADLTAKRETTEDALTKNQEALSVLAEKIEELERTERLAAETLSSEQASMQQGEIAQSRMENKLDQALTTLSEQYHTSLSLAQEQLVDLPMDTIMQRLKLLKRGLDDIGEVNVAAIEEYQRVKERYDFLTQQQEDLNEAKEKLLTTMNEMDQQVMTRFDKAFNQVNAQFQQTFKQVFGGGQARLELTDPEHLLTTGIEIMAEPPGKRLQSMRLLSGGERALTAITLLFAVIQVQPVPYCVLDEAEAALDPANTARFASFLNHFNDDTQFIVITHRKETMVETDRLYGITMQESGVSKLVSVDLQKTAN